MRDAIARIIDPEAFDMIGVISRARHWSMCRMTARQKADRILALLPDPSIDEMRRTGGTDR